MLDEAQVIKNEQTNIAKALRKLHFQNTLLLTGTPLQNNLHELWSILNFLYPDVFRTSTAFDREGVSTDAQALNQAHHMLKMCMLRRTKDLVEKEVPPKEEIKVNCALSPLQRQLYTALLSNNMGLLGDGDNGPRKKDFQQLSNLLMQLRKVCNHPFLFPNVEIDPDTDSLDEIVEASGKMQVLQKLLRALFAKGHRVVLFSSFTSVLDIIEDFLGLSDVPYLRLDGSHSRVERKVSMHLFNQPESEFKVFIMTTRAGGLGINLQTVMMAPCSGAPCRHVLCRTADSIGDIPAYGTRGRRHMVSKF